MLNLRSILFALVLTNLLHCILSEGRFDIAINDHSVSKNTDQAKPLEKIALSSLEPTLYSLSYGMQLGIVNTTTGYIESIGPTYSVWIAQQLSAVDSIRKIVYCIAYNWTNGITSLIGMNDSDGTIITNTELPLAQGSYIGQGQSCNVEPITGVVYVSGQLDINDTLHYIWQVDPVKNVVTELTTFEGENFLGAASVYDPNAKILWLQPTPNLNYGIDVTTGNIAFNESDIYNLVSLGFDYQTAQIYAIGELPDGTCCLCSLSSSTGRAEVISKLEGWTFPSLEMMAINSQDQVAYTYIAKSSNLPQHFLTINLTTGDIVLDVIPQMVPWAIEFIPAIMH